MFHFEKLFLLLGKKSLDYQTKLKLKQVFGSNLITTLINHKRLFDINLTDNKSGVSSIISQKQSAPQKIEFQQKQSVARKILDKHRQ